MNSCTSIAAVKRKIRLHGNDGLTMLKCSRLIEEIRDFDGAITISNGKTSVDGRSMIELLQLAAVAGSDLTVELAGCDADRVIQRIAPILAN